MRLLVCGGRNYTDKAAVYAVLDKLRAKRPITVLIHGDAAGADRLAGEWAKDRGIDLTVFPANWTKHKKAAGPERNARMLAEGKPEGVVAFPGKDGTANMIDLATRAGLTVWRPLG